MMNYVNDKKLEEYARKRYKDGFHGAAFGIASPDGSMEIIDEMIENDGIWVVFWPDLAMMSFNDRCQKLAEPLDLQGNDLDVTMIVMANSGELHDHFDRLFKDWSEGTWQAPRFDFSALGDDAVSVER